MGRKQPASRPLSGQEQAFDTSNSKPDTRTLRDSVGYYGRHRQTHRDWRHVMGESRALGLWEPKS
jgi:hypothetical protein